MWVGRNGFGYHGKWSWSYDVSIHSQTGLGVGSVTMVSGSVILMYRQFVGVGSATMGCGSVGLCLGSGWVRLPW